MILNILLIKKYGIYGAAFATLISYTTRIASLYVVSSFLDRIYFEFQRAFKMLILSTAVFLVCSNIDFGLPICNLALKVTILMTWPFLLVLTKFYTEDELEKIRSVISSVFLSITQKLHI